MIYNQLTFNYSLNSGKPGYIYDDRVRPLVKADGMVVWVPASILETSCMIDVSDYPFDKQR